jgi:hypothetical protein
MLYDNFKVYFTGQGVENLEILFMIKKWIGHDNC